MGKSGGGILVYINNSLQAKRREDLEAEDIEILWLEVCPYKSRRSLFIGCVHRPLSFRVADDKRLGKNIENVHLLNKETILLGDINIDFLCTMKLHKHPFIKTLKNLNMSQLVMEITRPLSKTCLDHIWSSHPARLINVRVLSTGMSDHLPTIVIKTYKGVQQNKTEHTTITYRDIKNLNKEQFIAALKEAPWDSAFIFNDPDDVVDTWYDIFQGVVDRYLPLKHERVKDHGLLLEKLKAYGHSKSTVDIYADDTTLSLSSDVTNGLTATSSALQQDLDDVSRWSAANKMVTNAAKTKCLLVIGKRIPCSLDNCSLELKLANSDIEQVDNQKLLGVTIDKHLSFDVHVEELCKKLSQRIAVLGKIRRFIPIEQRTLYYNAMTKQVMLYGSTIW
ncbi:hypothetical protein AWC38_SpisGene10487 [Stylophora pistillata]|uniref:Endonuclease/exonuclease/phosphatase domain-containing protein n=1 Tax=Stylophora pistillata TaxID=50429 RepID=A0A2B4S4S9_STYPI|nr:hypothetical protein AWC38_SpisGene10487 [Stylophora pistillata]